MTRRVPVVGILAGIVLVLLYLPIAAVVVNSFNADESLTGWDGFTWRWYEEAVADERIRTALLNSVAVALAATVLSMVLAVGAALWWRSASARGRRAVDLGSYMRIVLPEVVIATGLFVMLTRLEVELGFWTVVAGHVVINSAYATIILQARLAGMGTALEDAAADLGASPARVLWRATLPQLAPAIAVAALLVFTLSFDNVVLSLFLRGGTFETLPVVLLGLIRIRVTPEVNAIGSLVMLITAVTFLLAVAIAMFRSSGGIGLLTRQRPQERR